MKKSRKYLGIFTLGLAVCFSMTACGNSTTTGSTSGNNDNNVVEDVAEDAGDAVGDLAEGAGDAVGDVANGVGNAVDDLVGNGGFDNYNDAHDYFLDTMNSYHADANFEIRDEDRDLNDYQEGSKGYHFHLYDTSKNDDGDLFGEFFVDANSGQIYQKDKNGKINEYPGNDMGGGNANNDKKNGMTTGNNGTTTGKNGTTTGNNGNTNGNKGNSMGQNGTITGSNQR